MKHKKQVVQNPEKEPAKEPAKEVIEVPASKSQSYQDQGYEVIGVKGLGKNKVHILEKP